MPKGKPIPDEVKAGIYTSYTLGETTRDISDRTGLAVVTVRRIIRSERKRQEKRMEMGRSGKIVKKDGNGGKLMALSPEGFEFTHVTPDGKSHKKRMPGHMARIAEQQYDAWCQELDDECEFMRKVERKDEPSTDQPKEPEVVCGHPGDPIEEIRPIEPAPVPEIEVRPWKDVAEERQQRIEELEKRVIELHNELEDKERKVGRIDAVVEATEQDEPKLPQWFNDNGAFRVVWTDKPVYVIWAKADTPRLYGVYQHMEAALKELDKLNDVAAFLGSDDAFEVEEVTWKG